MLRVEKVSKSYRGELVLDNVSFEVPEGTIAGIIGPNGAGKSTVLKIITGFESPDAGAVHFRGKEINSFRERMLLISYMPEYVEIYPDYRVCEFIEFIHRATGYRNAELLAMLNFGSVAAKKIKNLSKGFKQRLKLFVALSNTRSFLVLDEPFDGFDPIQLLEILKLIEKENHKGRTFLLSIHQLGDAEKICDHYILLNEGKVIAQGTIERLKKDLGIDDGTLEDVFMAALI